MGSALRVADYCGVGRSEVVPASSRRTGIWNPLGSTICEKYGSDNRVFLAKVRF